MVFRVSSHQQAEAGYRVGYIAHDGTCRVCGNILYGVEFAVRIGRENCAFFAVNLQEEQIRLRQVRSSYKKDLAEHKIRLV